MERFIFHHPILYQKLLMAALLACSVSGVASLFLGHSTTKLSFVPTIQPPFSTSQPVSEISTAKEVDKPKGFETAQALPGRDGSATPATTVPAVNVAAVQAAIPLGAGGDVLSLGRALNAVEFGDQYWPSLQAMWNRESGWNPNARNASSGACGIPQALPCSKITDKSPQGQIEWGLQYIRQRYGDPNKAWQFWLAHHWY